ncbi:methyltransferase [subsurface metagenome]
MHNTDRKKAVQDFWDANPCAGGGGYSARLEWLKKTEAYAFDILNANIVEGKEILEVGCGQGFMANHVAQWAKYVIATDISKESLRLAQEGSQALGIHNVSYQWGDAEDLSFSDEQFDIVYCFGVLHHTPDTQKGINELCRILKPGGTAVVMLYKKYNPKWLVVAFFRTISKIIDHIAGQEFIIANRLRESYKKNPKATHGTALLELFGCPVLKMYSKRQLCQMFRQFQNLQINCYQPGFERLLDFLPERLKNVGIRRVLSYIDSVTVKYFGFYAVVKGEKQ